MKLDSRLLTGILIGAVLGLHYHAALVAYLPLIVIAGMVMLLKTIRH